MSHFCTTVASYWLNFRSFFTKIYFFIRKFSLRILFNCNEGRTIRRNVCLLYCLLAINRFVHPSSWLFWADRSFAANKNSDAYLFRLVDKIQYGHWGWSYLIYSDLTVAVNFRLPMMMRFRHTLDNIQNQKTSTAR